ncbi:MAG: carbohydrate ABC transporter permease [Cucumibacter sp.]
MNAEAALRDIGGAPTLGGGTHRIGRSRTRYLIGAVCVGLSALMVAPLVFSIMASVKTKEEANLVPPHYFAQTFSLESYERLWSYQAGLLTYLGNSTGAALLTIALCLGLTIPAGYALARYPIPGKEFFFVVLLMALIVPYQALLTPIFFMFVQLKLHNSILGLAIIHTTIQMPFSVYIMRNSFEAVPKEIAEAAVMDGASSWQTLLRIYLPAIRPAIVTVSLFAFITSWNELLGALVIMSKGNAFTLPVILTAARQETILGGTDWGMLQAGILISIVPCVLFYLLLQRYYVSGLLSGAVK